MTARPVLSSSFAHAIRPVARSAAATVLAVLAYGGSALAAEAEVKKPDCATLEKWAAGIDGKDQVRPIKSSRASIPRAFQDPAFAELFGAPALAWKAEDAKAVGAHVYKCGRAAAKARRREARTALYRARGYFTGGLRGVLSAQEQAENTAKRADEEAARRKARTASRARRAEAQRTAMAEEEAKRRAEREREEAARLEERTRAAGRVRREARQAESGRLARRSERHAPTPRGQAAAPAAPEKVSGDAMVADYRAKIEALENLPDSLRFLDRWEREIRRKVPPVAGKAESAKLLKFAAAKRQSIGEAMVTAAKKGIDDAEKRTDTDRQALDRIERIATTFGGVGLPREQVTAVRAYARQRQVPFADRELAAQTRKLDDYPETMKGLDRLQQAVHVARTGVLSRGSDAAKASYMKAAGARLTDIAEAALPEFKTAIAGLPESPMGLRATEMTVVSQKGFQEVAPNVRAEYEAVLNQRREAIAGAIGAKVAAARSEAVAAGGDSDLVGYRFVDKAKGWQLLFRDEKQAILASRRNRGAAPYQVRGAQVVIKGPQMPLVLNRSGSGAATKLEGLGFVFVRVGN